MQEEKAAVLWAPSAEGYTSRLTEPLGEKIEIPAPFGCSTPLGFQAPEAPEA
ncbi:hypothetical protein ACIRPU_04885 [Streptomyces sp. NPDC102259]|uniref:hypothetical protein n=1 Tax=Streptomyces sp. NPDC102259 TaxID=3366148 RepID=UPI003828A9F4